MTKTNIAIVGGGMTSTYMLKHFIENGDREIAITIFEKGTDAGPGMAYNRKWVNPEHLANSGSQEIPDLEIPLHEWLRNRPDAWLEKHSIKREEIHKGAVYPRVVLGAYFIDQFKKLLENAKQRGLDVTVETNSTVTDIADNAAEGKVELTVDKSGQLGKHVFDKTIIATGHVWPEKKQIQGVYDSPWPITKLAKPLNHPVAVIGSSLSAVDTVLTLADKHGKFERKASGELVYLPNPDSEQFSINMFSRRGLLPDLRCHFEYPEHDINRYVKEAEIEEHRKANGGNVSIDFFFKRYKEAVKKVDPEFYERIKTHDLKDFINFVVRERQKEPPFDWLKKEYASSQKSLAQKEPIHWKEILDDVTYSLSFYAKYLTAEDMLEFKRDLMPLAAYVIAFMPLESAEKLIALNRAGKLDLISTGQEWSMSTSPEEKGATLRYRAGGKDVDKHYDMVIKATGQQPTSLDQFPFRSLVEQENVEPMRLKFRDEKAAKAELSGTKPGEAEMVKHERDGYYFYPGGLSVNDDFRLIGKDGPNKRIFDVAMPHLLGCYPYTQSLPFCDHAAEIVTRAIAREKQKPVHGPWSQDAAGPKGPRVRGG